jgi:GH35 family endo-1,4-beta-xylanase
MLARGDRIDCMGFQMHRFNPQQTLDIAAGSSDQSPDNVRTVFSDSFVPNMKTHLSEITITSPGSDARGETIQAVVTKNLYRLWFSLEPMMGITWWNVVDDCGAPREPAISGLFHRDMTPKLSYFALNDLINREWRTNLSLKADANGAVCFRGFKGTYCAEWRDEAGNAQSKTFEVK